MTTRERLLLLALFAVVLVLLGRDELASTVLGTVAGGTVGALLSGRLRRLGARMDDRLGADHASRGFSVRRPLLRAGVLLVVLGALLATTVFDPFVGDELFAGAAAAVTALPAVLTAARLRR